MPIWPLDIEEVNDEPKACEDVELECDNLIL